MNNFIFAFLFSFVSFFSLAQNNFVELADVFLKKHVSNGLVDYSSIKAEPTELYKMLNAIALKDIPETDYKAYLINSYNILVIASIVEALPILSPEGVPGFFTDELHVLANKKVSLNFIEKTLLFKEFKDPRLHFVLVCGALGCPPITNFAYQTNELETQLKTQTKLALNSDFVRIDKKKEIVSLSEIFRWYAKDFRWHQ